MQEGGGASRRSFLKIGGAAALLATVNHDAEGAVGTQSQPAKEGGANSKWTSGGGGRLVDLVNPLQGTESTIVHSRGNTMPIVALPFAMAHWALQSTDVDPWFFQLRDERLQGICCTHQLSVWLGDYGQATFLPFTGAPSPQPVERASSYRPGELKMEPHAITVRLARYRCLLELAPAERCSVMRFTFEESGDAGLFIDLPGKDAEAHYDSQTGVITGLTRENKGGVPAGFASYFVVRADAEITRFEVKELPNRRVAVVRFHAQAGKPVTVRVATSFISFEQAARNLKNEIGDKPFEQVKNEAAAVWEKALGRVRIKGGTETQHRIFHSGLFRALLYPRIWHELDAQGKQIHFSLYSGKVEPGVMYADHGYWDDYRAWYPMMALLYPERLSEILEGWVNAYKEGGWLPQFPCPGYKAAMTGTPIDFVFGDAVSKSVTGFDLQAAYQGLKKHATQPVAPGLGYGRPAVAEYAKLGYIPCDLVVGGLAETLDSTYGDFCIAQVARAAGKLDDAAMFEERSRNWRKVFDPKTRFLRGKLADGSWAESEGTFDPFLWGGPYVEGAAWQYRFSVPYDPDGLVEAMGGKAAFIASLEEMLSQPPAFKVGSYGYELHEMAEMAEADFGQYAHSNQPVHHVLYMFTVAGRRDLTQHWVHRVLNELYSVDNFCGDEDTGSMSAWYILSSMGFYSMCPGKPEWVLGAPIFDQVDIRYPDGREIHVEAHSRKPGAFFNRVTLNGVEHRDSVIQHAEFLKGARLVFTAT